MKRATLCFAILLGLPALIPGQHGARRPPNHMGFDSDPLAEPVPSRSPAAVEQVDREQVQRDADELVSLARSVSGDVSQTRKGIRPRDLGPNLKKIEKLAKQLRGELAL
ncbi:MAG TPA: hypothetical protein VJV74_04400 [Terriglobia bacterium]|nr:hypothetical protein [Terriglobia bacterium]